MNLRYGRDAVKDLPQILSHNEFVKHVALKPIPTVVLNSPVTEVMLAYFPADIPAEGKASKAAATARLEEFADKALSQCADIKGWSFGWGVEDGQKGNLLTLLIGWPSVQAHMKFRETEVFKENVGLITGMEGLDKTSMLHVSCRGIERNKE